jgi:hypothetical protein
VRKRTVEIRRPDGNPTIYLVATAYVTFMLRAQEMWARSYAQYIATRSGDPILRAQLFLERERLAGMPYYPEQWDDDDFAPIAEAIDELLNAKGWRR